MLLCQELYIYLHQGSRKKSLTVIYKLEPNGSLNLHVILPEGNARLNNLKGQMKALPSLEVTIITFRKFCDRMEQQGTRIF